MLNLLNIQQQKKKQAEAALGQSDPVTEEPGTSPSEGGAAKSHQPGLPLRQDPQSTQSASRSNGADPVSQDYGDRLAEDLTRIARITLAEAVSAVITRNEQSLNSLTSAVRRIRDCDSTSNLISELINSVTIFCNRSVMLLHDNGKMAWLEAAGEGLPPVESAISEQPFDVGAVPWIERVVNSKKKHVITGEQADVSGKLLKSMGCSDDDEVHAYPFTLRDTVLAVVLVHHSSDKPLDSQAIEVLILVAEAWIEVLNARMQFKRSIA